jgi:hypothetical protein
MNLQPAIDGRGQLEENSGTTQAVPAARSRASSSARSRRFARVARAGRADHHRGMLGTTAWSRMPCLDDGDLIEALGALEPVWDEIYPAEQARILRLLIERVDVAPDGISVTLHAAGIRSLVAELAGQEAPALALSDPLLEAAE